MNGLVELKILFLNIMYMNLRATDSQNSCLLLLYVLWYSSFLLLLSSTKRSVWDHNIGQVEYDVNGVAYLLKKIEM